MALVVLRVSCSIEHPGFWCDTTGRRGEAKVLEGLNGYASVVQQREPFRTFGRQRHQSHGRHSMG